MAKRKKREYKPEKEERSKSMSKNTKVKEQMTMFGTYEFPSHEEIIEAYSKEFTNYILPKGDTIFGFWMQTLADLEFLSLELEGLTEEYTIDSVNRTVDFKGDEDFIRLRIAHLEKVKGKKTLYTELVDTFGDTNAYAFHNLYPYKGKFYPRIVRTLINAFKLRNDALLLDPFNGSGTATHEASLMGIKSVGVDVTPMGIILSELKNALLFINAKVLDFSLNDLKDILHKIKTKKWKYPNSVIYKLMLAIYFDTIDAFVRTSRYKKKGETGLFIEKFYYIKECHKKIMEIKEKYGLRFKPARIIAEDVLKLKNLKNLRGRFDAVITSPPYYFSIDYVGKDKIAYDYLGIDMKKVESKYLGMKNSGKIVRSYGQLPMKVIMYYEDLKKSIENIFWALKPKGKLAIIVGDSTVSGRKIPTTMITKKFCEEIGFKFQKLIFNPLLGARNRAIRGESIIICERGK